MAGNSTNHSEHSSETEHEKRTTGRLEKLSTFFRKFGKFGTRQKWEPAGRMGDFGNFLERFR